MTQSDVTAQTCLYKERYASDDVVIGEVNDKIEKAKYLSEFECLIIVGAWRAGDKTVSKMTTLLKDFLTQQCFQFL